MTDQLGHVIDIMATCVDAAGTAYPPKYSGAETHPLEGKSLLPVFYGKSIPDRGPIFWEHEGNAAIRVGDQKLVRLGIRGEWELFDLRLDRTEQHDLADDLPDDVERLARQWRSWATSANVLPKPPRENAGKKKAKKKKNKSASEPSPASS